MATPAKGVRKGEKLRILNTVKASLRGLRFRGKDSEPEFKAGDIVTATGEYVERSPGEVIPYFVEGPGPNVWGLFGGEGGGWERVRSEARLPEAILRPGLLVRLSVTIEGGVTYQTRTIQAETLEGQAARSEWETTKIVADKAEHDQAVALRARIRNDISGACVTRSQFGLMCPDSAIEDLTQRVERSQALAREFNARASTCSVRVAAITGRIATDDVAAARAIRGEISALLAEVQRGIEAADPKRIRDACNAARDVGAMLSSDASERVQKAIEAARKVARKMTARVKEAGEQAAEVLTSARLDALDGARLAFLDTDVPEGTPLDPIAQGARALDLDTPESTAPVEPERSTPREIDDAPAGDPPTEIDPIAARELD